MSQADLPPRPSSVHAGYFSRSGERSDSPGGSPLTGCPLIRPESSRRRDWFSKFARLHTASGQSVAWHPSLTPICETFLQQSAANNALSLCGQRFPVVARRERPIIGTAQMGIWGG